MEPCSNRISVLISGDTLSLRSTWGHRKKVDICKVGRGPSPGLESTGTSILCLAAGRWSPEKAMAPYSSTVARKIPWTEEPGGLQSMGSQRVRYDWATSLSLSTFMHWRRKWQPTPVFLPGESQGRGSLVGCSPWGCTESDTTVAT